MPPRVGGNFKWFKTSVFVSKERKECYSMQTLQTVVWKDTSRNDILYKVTINIANSSFSVKRGLIIILIMCQNYVDPHLYGDVTI